MELPLKRVEEFLHQRIPLSKAMNCQVQECAKNSITLFVPKFANTVENDRFFYGGLSTLGTLNAWTLAQVALRRLDYEPDIRLLKADWKFNQEPSVEATEIRSICKLPSDKEWQQCLRMLSRKAQANITLKSDILEENKRIATVTCEFQATDLDHQGL
ncbi:MAG: YiiD C-terminal domain-containing protein [Verrucomicrobiota bacterium]